MTATATIAVAQATPTITWANPASIVYGTALSSAQLDATASVPGTFTYTPAAGTVLGAGNSQTLSVTFTPTDSTDYKSASATASINVLPVPLASATIVKQDATTQGDVDRHLRRPGLRHRGRRDRPPLLRRRRHPGGDVNLHVGGEHDRRPRPARPRAGRAAPPPPGSARRASRST